jgi:hypothetical protein
VRFSNPTVRNCVFTGNRAGAGGGISLLGSYGSVENCTMQSNVADYGSNYGGGGLYSSIGRPKVVNCTIQNNTTEGIATGGGIGTLNSWAEFTNCLIAGNSSLDGGAIRHTKGEIKVTNCTLIDNTATFNGGTYYSMATNSAAQFSNCILWNNTSVGSAIVSDGGAVLNIAFSNVPGGFPGVGNIDVNPMFNNIESGSYDLQPGSPCVDAGDLEALPDDVTTDLAGNSRVFGDAVDMGAFETQYVMENACPADIRPSSGDGQVTIADVLAVFHAYGHTCDDCIEDIAPEHRDGYVNINDIVSVMTHMGPCPE